jgi:sugar O-acyltransferase (sialic acid O-acetyltransferase NeuD family)
VNLVIFGIGRGADVATRYFGNDSPHEVVAYTVDDAYADQTTFLGRPVVPFSRLEHEIPPADASVFVALGYQRLNALRSEKCAEARAKGYELASYVSSRILAPERPQVGDNCLILDGNVFDHDVRIGNNVVMWSANHVGDFAVIEDDAWISSQVAFSGSVTVGTAAFVGVNATLANNVRVGARCYIGANALVTRDTGDDEVYVVPATPRVEGIDSSRFLAMIEP